MLEERTRAVRLLVEATLWRPIFSLLTPGNIKKFGYMTYSQCLIFPDGTILAVGEGQSVCYLHFQSELIVLPAIDLDDRQFFKRISYLLRSSEGRREIELLRFDQLGMPKEGLLLRDGFITERLIVQEGTDQLHLAQFCDQAPEDLFNAVAYRLNLGVN